MTLIESLISNEHHRMDIMLLFKIRPQSLKNLKNDYQQRKNLCEENLMYKEPSYLEKKTKRNKIKSM